LADPAHFEQIRMDPTSGKPRSGCKSDLWKNLGQKISWHTPFKHSECGRIWIRPKIRIQPDPNPNTVQPHDFYTGLAPGRIKCGSGSDPNCKASQNVNNKKTDKLLCYWYYLFKGIVSRDLHVAGAATLCSSGSVDI
jgi:hypothetical protein